MKTREIRHLPVVDRNARLVRLGTDRDLRQALFDPSLQGRLEAVATTLGQRAIRDVMTRSVLTVPGADLDGGPGRQGRHVSVNEKIEGFFAACRAVQIRSGRPAASLDAAVEQAPAENLERLKELRTNAHGGPAPRSPEGESPWMRR
jgi:hypothetical protein